MIFDTTIKESRAKAKKYILDLFNSHEGKVEIKRYKTKRTSKQNRALHLFFRMIADELNDNGHEYRFFGVCEDKRYSFNCILNRPLDTRFTETIIKETLWRRLQVAMYGIESTTKIDTQIINNILDVIIKHFGTMGIHLAFPNQISYYETLIDREDNLI